MSCVGTSILVSVICFLVFAQGAPPPRVGETVNNTFIYNGTLFKSYENMSISVTVIYPRGWTISKINASFEWSKEGYATGSLTRNGIGTNSWQITLNLDTNIFGVFQIVVITQHEVSEEEYKINSYPSTYSFDELVINRSGPGIIREMIKVIKKEN
ncbi:hypothetical protein L9F63_008034 [Diploptera punctata]|uniref:Salivary secreted peptide n=1 Tax=Diploptera punctata TaxID=6984 RepID=A0AAD7Z6H3_DIPPU|nr:hypothetical protein L9F63_008034 [Diploptera punctata]